MARLAPSDNSDNADSDVDTIARQARIYRGAFPARQWYTRQ